MFYKGEKGLLIKFVNNLGNCNIIEFTCGVDNEVVLKDEQEIVLDVKDGDYYLPQTLLLAGG